MSVDEHMGWVIARQKLLFNKLAGTGFQGIFLNPGPSMAYLTGLEFHLSERPVAAMFIRDGKLVFVLPEMEAGKLKDLPYPARAFTYLENPDSWDGAFRAGVLASGISGGRVGIEPRRMRMLELGYLQKGAPGVEFDSAEDLLASLRMIKDETEIERMRRAARIAQDALELTLKQIRLGSTEQELANELAVNLIRAGSEPELPFQPLVSFGAHSADPHAFPTTRKLQPGDLILIDWGANVEDYFSDITRVFSAGETHPRLREAAEVVAAANEAAQVVAGPGVRAGDVDLAARSVIEKAGSGEFIRHRTGHGLGRESHEEPYIRMDNDLILETGMTFTIEPGLYIDGVGGIRIEDDVVITQDGLESLTDLSRELIFLNLG